MRVLEESHKGVVEGMTIALEQLGLPAPPNKALLIVFWKKQ